MLKRILIILTIAFGFFIEGFGQVNPHAIGLRLGGDGDANDIEVSYQHGIKSNQRLELDLGVGSGKNHDRLFIVGIYHWNWNLTSGLNWFVGPGAALGFHSYQNADDHINIGIGGQIGLEYDFNELDVPILVSLDTRPMWDFVGNNPGLGWGIALGVRYTW